MTDDGPSPATQTELDRLNLELGELGHRATEAHQAWVAADAIFRATLARRDQVAAELRTAGAPGQATGTAAPTQTPASDTTLPPAPSAVPVAGGPAPEASTHTVQNLLFILGGLLLGIAAIVFTAVAWATFGNAGRAAVLAGVTVVTLALPLIALARRLSATAETFAAVGLLLVVLDGYAAWAVNLGGLQAMPGTRFAGLVCVAAAAAGVAYRTGTRLIGPAFAALVAIQPALPLIAADWRPSAAGWSALASAVAAINVLVIWRHGSPRARTGRTVSIAIRAIAWGLLGLALLVAGLIALDAEIVSASPGEAGWAALASMMVAVVFAAASAVIRVRLLHRIAAAGLVLAAALGAGRAVAVAWPAYRSILVAVVIFALAVAAGLVGRALPRLRPGPAVGTAIAAAAVGLATTLDAVSAAVRAIARSIPMWTADVSEPGTGTWQLAVEAVVVAMAIAVVLPRSWRSTAAAVGAAVAMLALIDMAGLTWWAPAVLAAAGACGLLVVAVGGRTARTTVSAASAAGILVIVAVLTSLARPALTGAVLAGLAVAGLTAAVVAGRRPVGGADRIAVGGCALVLGLLAGPPAIGSALVAAGTPGWWAARATVAAVAGVVLALGLLGRPGPRLQALTQYAFAATLVSAVTWPAVAANTERDAWGVYSAVSLTIIALALTTQPAVVSGWSWAAGVAAVPGLAGLAIAVGPAVLTVVALPYAWVGAVWSGPPSGVGLAPPGQPQVAVTWSAAAALTVLALASAVTTFALTRRIRSALGGLLLGGPTAIVVGVVAAGARWPGLPAALLATGYALVLAATLTPLGRSGWLVPLAVGQGVIYVGAGVAGALSQEWSTLAALGSTVVVGVVIGTAGRPLAGRVTSWLVAVAAALATAAAAGLAADLAARDAALGVLGVSVAALFLGAVLDRRSARTATTTIDEPPGPGPRPDGTAADEPPGPGPDGTAMADEPPRARPEGTTVDGPLRPRRAEATATSAAAHAGAVVAMLFTLGWPTHTAAVSAVWGVAVGLRALWPGTSRAGRAGLAAAGGGFELLAWWLLLADREVTLIEAYTLPLAAVSLIAGWAALRARPELRSWVAYGPALAAAFLPSLAAVIGTAGEPWRRLTLGVGTLAVVIAGATARRQAPVVIGGLVLLIVAVHEIVLAWQLLPGWIPLAVGGALLVGLAITYERRRRDLRRLRAALRQMS